MAQLRETVKAFVVRKPGAALEAEGLLAFLREHLSLVEMPKQVKFRDALPRTLICKLSKKELVAEERVRWEIGRGTASTKRGSDSNVIGAEQGVLSVQSTGGRKASTGGPTSLPVKSELAAVRKVMHTRFGGLETK